MDSTELESFLDFFLSTDTVLGTYYIGIYTKPGSVTRILTHESYPPGQHHSFPLGPLAQPYRVSFLHKSEQSNTQLAVRGVLSEENRALLKELRIMAGFFCFDSCICNPLHAARRAMAAAVPLPPKEQRRAFLE